LSFLSQIKTKANKYIRKWRAQDDLVSRLKNIAHLLTGNFAGALIGLAAFALTARALGPNDYGILALCFTFTRAIERIVSFQSWQPLIKFGAEAIDRHDVDDIRRLLKFGLLLDMAAAAAAWLVAVAVVIFFSALVGISPETRSFALIYSTVLLFQISGMPTAVLRLYGRFSALAYSQVFGSIVRVILSAAGVLLSWGLFEFTLIWMGMQILSSLSMTLLAFLELRRRGVGGILSAGMKGITSRFPGLWRFALSANFSLTIRSSANELDTLLVGFFASPASAGLYHIAKRIGRIAQQAGVQVQAVVYPELARLWAAQSIEKFRRVVRHTELMLLAAGLVLVGVVYLTIEPILIWTAGADFVAAAPLASVQAFAVALTLCGTVMRSALLAMGRESAVLTGVLISTAAFHVTAIALIPLIGAMGANVAHIVMAFIWMGSMALNYRSGIRRNWPQSVSAVEDSSS
jgi:O-antigen/teichoic acid export membrane protein